MNAEIMDDMLAIEVASQFYLSSNLILFFGVNTIDGKTTYICLETCLSRSLKFSVKKIVVLVKLLTLIYSFQTLLGMKIFKLLLGMISMKIY